MDLSSATLFPSPLLPSPVLSFFPHPLPSPSHLSSPSTSTSISNGILSKLNFSLLVSEITAFLVYIVLSISQKAFSVTLDKMVIHLPASSPFFFFSHRFLGVLAYYYIPRRIFEILAGMGGWGMALLTFFNDWNATGI